MEKRNSYRFHPKLQVYIFNKKVLKSVKLSRLDVPSCIQALDAAADELKVMMETQTLTNNEICTKITNIIYSTCKSNRKTSTTTVEQTLHNQNCSSQHYFAIAQANFRRYQQLLLEGRDINEYLTYLNTWVEAEKLAKEHKEEEMNTRVNKNWTSCKQDGRSLWRAIDWKGKM